MILNYAHRNAITPHVTPEHIAKFEQMAHAEDPGLKARMPLYHKVAGDVSRRIEGLDPDRRRLAHDDLNHNMLSHVKAALATGKTKAATKAIEGHLRKLAGQYGVQMPQEPGQPGQNGA